MIDWALYELCCHRFLQRLHSAQELLRQNHFKEAANEYELILSGFKHRLFKIQAQLTEIKRDSNLDVLRMEIGGIMMRLDELAVMVADFHKTKTRLTACFIESYQALVTILQAHIQRLEGLTLIDECRSVLHLSKMDHLSARS